MAAHRFITTVGQSSHVGADAIKAFALVGREPARFGEIYRPELEHAPNIQTYLYANVAEIETNESASEVSRVRVACLSGNRFWVKAKLFVLATCAIQNARLLLLSNKRQHTGLGNQHDLVGRYFLEHPTIPRAGRLMVSDPSLSRGIYERHLRQGARLTCLIAPALDAQRRDKLLNCSIRLHNDAEDLGAIKSFKHIIHRLRGDDVSGDLSKDLIMVVADIDGVARYVYRRTWRRASEFETAERYRLTYSAEQAPNPSSRVSLSNEKDALGQPRAKLEWRLMESDLRNARVVLQKLGEELGRISVGRVKVELADENEALSKSFAGSWHHMGTTRMSADPKKGVVDKNCRVHGIGNLFIASSSTFPTSGHANPTLTIVALTLRLADHLKELLYA
ncbi:MAG: GMC family oxidoreductase [Gammaproteobacteria bacterium]